MKLKRKNTIGLYYVCTDHDDSAQTNMIWANTGAHARYIP